MSKTSMVAAALVTATTLVSPSWAADLSVSGAWFRALPEGLPAAGYFSIHNAGTAPAVLSGVQSPTCGMLMLHQSSEKAGTSSMQDVERVTIPAGGSFVFRPGGYHLMCTNPGNGMKPGNSVRVTLRMADGRTLEVKFAVRTATGK